MATTNAANIISDSMIAAYAKGVGFTGDDAVTATAIAIGESGGNANAHNYNILTRDDSYGLWQINMFGSLGQPRLIQFGIVIKEQLLDPGTNAKAAYSIFKAQGFKAWSVWVSGAYRVHMARAKTAVDAAANVIVNPSTGTQVGGKVGDIIDSLNPLPGLMKWVEAGVLRIAGFVAGAVLVVLAVVLYARNQVAT